MTALTAIALGFRGVEQIPQWVSFLTDNMLTLLLLVVVVVQAYIYRRQWEVMKTQERVLEKQASTFESQVTAMQGQLTAMQDGLAQNERAVAAAEQSVEIARQSFYVGEAPYFGITKITFEWILNNVYAGTKGGGRPQVGITFLNGGKTPAWHLSVVPHLTVGDSPEKGTWLTLNSVHDRECPDAENTFYPSGAEKCIKYEGRDEIGGAEIEAIRSQTTSLFLIVEIGYTDMRNIRQTRTLYRRFNPLTDRFGDYLAGIRA